MVCVCLSLVPALAAQATASAASGSKASASDAEQRRFVAGLVSRMTLEEKAGQLNQLNQDPGTDEQARLGRVGSYLWVTDVERINRLQHLAVDESRLHIPLIFGFDVIHGYHTIFPEPLAMAASFDPKAVEAAQAAAAAEASANGINWTFAPMLDIARDARWGRIVEGAGEDSYLGAAMAAAQVRGFQGEHLGSPGRIAATAKHFAGYGAADGGRDYDSSYIPEELLRNVYFPPFKAAIGAGAGVVMSAYMDLNDVPATGNSFLLRDVLRKEWGFQGFVVSDWKAVPDLVTHAFAVDEADAARRAIEAGVNMDMMGKTLVDQIPSLVKDGKVSVATLDAAVSQILLVKVKLGLFEHPYVASVPPKGITPEMKSAAKAAALRSAVLLRNEGNVLPLKKSSSIAVVGALADSKQDTLGSWAFVADVASTVTLLAGLRNKLGPSANVLSIPVQPLPYDPGLNKVVDATDDEIARAVESAEKADVIVAVMGESAKMSGENSSRTSLELPGRQLDILKGLAATGKPVVLVLMNGRPLAIPWAAEHIPAILETWYMGSDAGDAVADLLYGDANPGGKLPAAFPRSAGQEPLYYAHNQTHVPETGKDFVSRYWDAPSSPQFPFGFGLSYTRFALSNLKLSTTEISANGSLQVSVRLENQGNRDGDEVVQLYIHQRAGRASRPVRLLKGFERVTLKAHTSSEVTFTVSPAELRYWAQGRYAVDPGTYDLYVGQSSVGGLQATFKVQP